MEIRRKQSGKTYLAAEKKASGINSSTATTHKIWGVSIQAFVVSEAAYSTRLRRGNVPAENDFCKRSSSSYLLLVFLCVYFSRHVGFTLFGVFGGSLVPSTSVGVSLCLFPLFLFFIFSAKAT